MAEFLLIQSRPATRPASGSRSTASQPGASAYGIAAPDRPEAVTADHSGASCAGSPLSSASAMPPEQRICRRKFSPNLLRKLASAAPVPGAARGRPTRQRRRLVSAAVARSTTTAPQSATNLVTARFGHRHHLVGPRSATANVVGPIAWARRSAVTALIGFNTVAGGAGKRRNLRSMNIARESRGPVSPRVRRAYRPDCKCTPLVSTDNRSAKAPSSHQITPYRFGLGSAAIVAAAAHADRPPLCHLLDVRIVPAAGIITAHSDRPTIWPGSSSNSGEFADKAAGQIQPAVSRVVPNEPIGEMACCSDTGHSWA